MQSYNSPSHPSFTFDFVITNYTDSVTRVIFQQSRATFYLTQLGLFIVIDVPLTYRRRVKHNDECRWVVVDGRRNSAIFLYRAHIPRVSVSDECLNAKDTIDRARDEPTVVLSFVTTH